MGSGSSERYTTYAISACPETHKQVDLTRTWLMHLLWPCELKLRDRHLSMYANAISESPSVVIAGSHRPSDPIPSQATPTFDNTLQFSNRSSGAYTSRRVVSGLWALHILKRVVRQVRIFLPGSITPCLLHQIALRRYMFQSQCGISPVATQERPQTLLKKWTGLQMILSTT